MTKEVLQRSAMNMIMAVATRTHTTSKKMYIKFFFQKVFSMKENYNEKKREWKLVDRKEKLLVP